MNDIVITPLGTVSTFCKDDKCCPGFLIDYKDNKIMLDCGNGVSKYLNLPNDFNNLSIFISHLHSDHYGELLSLAQTSLVFKRLGFIDNKIKVYIPNGDKNEYKNLIDFDYLMNLEKNSYMEFIPYDFDNKFIYDDLIVSFSKNPHDIITYSIKLENKDFKVVYSSDTGYVNNSLEKFARNSDILICESTFLKGQEKKNDFHLYASEAGMIAKNANVDMLLLTHFWPSIDKELYVKEAMEYFNNTSAAIEGKKLVLGR